MLSKDLKDLGEHLEARREEGGGINMNSRDVALLLSAVYTAAEDTEGLERSKVGAPARGAVVPLAPNSRRRAALKRLVTIAPVNGGDAA
jgi:hypothetical protein